MPEEIQEIHEQAEHVQHDPSLAPVTLTMAILAVLVAAAGLLGHRAHTEEILLQNKATDQWAYFQAKNIRRHTYELFLDLLSISDAKDSERAQKMREKYSGEIKRYNEEQKDIEAEAKKLEDDTGRERRKADRFDLGEVCLEASLVMASITLLTKRRIFWGVGLAGGLLGVSVTLAGILVH